MATKAKVQLIPRGDLREFGFFQTHNFVVDDYLTIIGSDAYTVYSVLVRRAMRDRGMSTKLPQEIIRDHLHIGKSTMPISILTLELCGLIYVNRVHRKGSEYFILDTVQLYDPKTQQLNTAALDEIKERITQLNRNPPSWAGGMDDSNHHADTDTADYSSLKRTLLKRIDEFESLFQRLDNFIDKERDHIEIINRSQPNLFNINGHQPANDLPTHDELVARLVRGFADAKPPLTEAAALKMIEQYGVEAVIQQFNWLESRGTDTPLKTLRAALKGNWTEPKAVGKAQVETFTPAEMAVIKAKMNESYEPAPVETGHVLSLPPNPMWQEVKERLQMQTTQATYDTWVRPTKLLEIKDNQWTIQCESTFAKDWLENRLNGTIARTVSSVAGQEIKLIFVTQS
jgi:DnaA N-terminal domain